MTVNPASHPENEGPGAMTTTAPDTHRRKPRSACRCRNHLNRPKVQHKSPDAALTWIMRNLRHAISLTYYPCPTQPGVWHVRSERVK